MKTLLAILIFAIVEINYAQIIPHKATLTASKDSALADETFTVTYTLKDCYPGHIYIGLMDGYFEAIGSDRWDGEIKEGETKTAIFTVKLKDSAKKWIQEKIPLEIGYSYEPFSERIGEHGTFDGIIIKIENYKEIKAEISETRKKILDKQNGIYLYPVDSNTILLKKGYKIDTTIPRQEYFRSTSNHSFYIDEKSKYMLNPNDENNLQINNLTQEINDCSNMLNYTLIFNAPTMSFRNITNQKLP